MPVSPEQQSSFKGRKINISMMLKVPIDLEVEVFEKLPSSCNIIENQEFLNQIKDSVSKVVIDEVSQGHFYEESGITSSEVTDSFEQDSQLSTSPQIQPEEVILEKCDRLQQGFTPTRYANAHPINPPLSEENFVAIEVYTPPLKKKAIGRVTETLNDGLTLVVNTMGAILFLGKLANYSWE
ncbi:MAG: hypothetical protein SAK29_17320 [Scytonema sp. PMC 1069.18]|nr:hypothetical protein [Scytonema sp. PMC 1069.18]MEC4882191.1 hypothetical protein [Scytonema sp. PMC 1070.18]